MIDREIAEKIAETFLDQNFSDIGIAEPFARFAQAMEFTDPSGNEILISMADNGSEYFCKVTVGYESKRCYNYHDAKAIADTICEF